jgi:hypothetical protein
MNIVIKMINNDKIIINIDEHDTFLKLKYILQEKTNINVKSQRLIFQGMHTSDDKRISDYNISDGFVIYLILSIY